MGVGRGRLEPLVFCPISLPVIHGTWMAEGYTFSFFCLSSKRSRLSPRVSQSIFRYNNHALKKIGRSGVGWYGFAKKFPPRVIRSARNMLQYTEYCLFIFFLIFLRPSSVRIFLRIFFLVALII